MADRYWLDRRADLTAEALELWREYDRLVEERIDETDETRRADLQALIEQVAMAAKIVEYYAHRAYIHAWNEPQEVGEAVALAYMDTPADWPWTDEDMRDEIMNRYPD